MRNIRIYQPGSYHVGQELTLSEQAGQHVGVVLRLKPGDRLTLFPGDGHEYHATILTIKRQSVVVRLDSIETCDRESPLDLHLAQAVSKGERMEWVVQKAVELGVVSIQPVLTERSVVRMDADRWAKKRQQWQAIAYAACEQSGRAVVPMIAAPCTYFSYLHSVNAAQRFILHPSDSSASWREHVVTRESVALLIGPEGGFSDQEVMDAQKAHFTSISLGPRVLRTETAALVALSVLQVLAGDL